MADAGGDRVPSRILLVEDDETIAALITFLLEREGFEVTHAADGLQALAAAVAATPDLVVLDMMLPHIGGQEVLETLRLNPGTAALPVVVLTAKSGERDVVKALESGADDYVTKPFRPEELVARVRRALRTRG